MLLFIYMNIAIASSWNIIGGYAGYISLGHNVFFAIGGYFSGDPLRLFRHLALHRLPARGPDRDGGRLRGRH